MKPNKHTDEAYHVKQLIRAYLDVDITTKSRKREIVQAKHIFVHILRSAKCTCVEVGRHMGMDYTSVLHYERTFDAYYEQSAILRDKYHKIHDKYTEKYDPRLSLTTCELRKDLIAAQKLVKELSLKLKESNDIQDNKEFTKLHKLIDERTRTVTQDEVYRKLNAIYNGI